MLVQTSNSVEIYNDALYLVQQGYKLKTLTRYHFEYTVSIPLAQLKSLRHRLCRIGVAHCLIAEQGYVSNHLKKVHRLYWRPVELDGE